VSHYYSPKTGGRKSASYSAEQYERELEEQQQQEYDEMDADEEDYYDGDANDHREKS
jgi:hypothetical protein